MTSQQKLISNCFTAQVLKVCRTPVPLSSAADPQWPAYTCAQLQPVVENLCMANWPFNSYLFFYARSEPDITHSYIEQKVMILKECNKKYINFLLSILYTK